MASATQPCPICGTPYDPLALGSRPRETCSSHCGRVLTWRRRERVPLSVRFWSKVDKSGPPRPTLGSPCWLWTAATVSGYGVIGDHGKQLKAHRLTFLWSGRVIPPGLHLDHLCRVRHCVNPDHLEAVTCRENIMRSPIAVAALNVAKTHCLAGHPLSGENLRVWHGERLCRACNAVAVLKYRAKKRAQA